MLALPAYVSRLQIYSNNAVKLKGQKMSELPEMTRHEAECDAVFEAATKCGTCNAVCHEDPCAECDTSFCDECESVFVPGVCHSCVEYEKWSEWEETQDWSGMNRYLVAAKTHLFCNGSFDGFGDFCKNHDLRPVIAGMPIWQASWQVWAWCNECEESVA